MKKYGDQVWEDIFNTRQWGKYPSEEAVRFYFHATAILKRQEIKALDLGSGSGAVSWFMRHEGAEVTAIDGSPAAMRQLHANAAAFNAHIDNAIIGDITRPLDFLPPGFDIVIDHYSLLSNTKDLISTAFSHIFQLLNPGGFFLTCMIGPDSDGLDSGTIVAPDCYSNISSGILARDGILCTYSPAQLHRELAAAGFILEYTESMLHHTRRGSFSKIICCARKSPTDN